MIATLTDKSPATAEMYRQKGLRILTTLGDVNVHDIDRAMLLEYIGKRKKHAEPHTIKKELITIRRALKESVASGILATLPNFPEYSPAYVPRSTWLTTEDFERVYAEIPEGYRLWAALAARAGLRAGEVERLTWSMVQGRWLAVPGTKTAKARRRVPISDALAAELDKVPAKRRKVHVVVAHWHNVRRDLRTAVDKANARLAKEAADRGDERPHVIPYVSPNDLRRTFASWLIQAGVDRYVVAQLLGHSTTRMVELVYGKLSDGQLEKAVGAMTNCDAGVSDLVRFGGSEIPAVLPEGSEEK